MQRDETCQQPKRQVAGFIQKIQDFICFQFTSYNSHQPSYQLNYFVSLQYEICNEYVFP